MPLLTTLALVGAGLAGFGLAGGFSKDSRIGDLQMPQPSSAGTGQLTEAQAQAQSKKRAFRSGILFTSPTGLSQSPNTASTKLR